ELGQVEGTDTYRDIERNDDAHGIPGLLIYRIDDELFFANAAFFARDVKARLIAADPPAQALIIATEGVSDIDTTAIQELDDLLQDLREAGLTVTFARVRRPVLDMLERAGVLERHGRSAIYLEVDDAVAAYRSQHRNDDGTEA
ncbi:MAG: STAS domain-containing protein, partial [Acidimicrobiales bacterium]